MTDLRSDDRMGWLPEQDMWLTALRVRERADRLTHDLSIDATGYRRAQIRSRPGSSGLSARTFDAGTTAPTVPLAGLAAAIAVMAVAGAAYAAV